MELDCLILGSHLTLFAYFLGFDIPTSPFIYIGNVFLLFIISIMDHNYAMLIIYIMYIEAIHM